MPANVSTESKCRVKLVKLRSGWCAKAQIYIKKMNEIIVADKSKCPQLLQDLVQELKPNQDLLKDLTTASFLGKKFTFCPLTENAKTIMRPAASKPEYIYWYVIIINPICCNIIISAKKVLSISNPYPACKCSSVCKNDWKFPRESRVLTHILSKAHHLCLKGKNAQLNTTRQREQMQEYTTTAVDGNELIKRIQNYVSQNVAARSFPFTAGEMALDCVAATLSTITGDKSLKRGAVDLLNRSGMRDEAAAMRNLLITSGYKNSGGPTPTKSPTKRRRIQLRRGAIKKRIKILGDDVQTLKREFLKACPYITIVIDEGNNWSKECPLYVAVIACTPEFQWRIMFIGQENCSGKKDGHSIHVLVKKIFCDTGMGDIYSKIVSASTDGASVMRSSSEFAGLDCRGTEGRSFAAHLKSEVKQDIDFWHCLTHQLNLAVNDSLDAIKALKLYWVPHVSFV